MKLTNKQQATRYWNNLNEEGKFQAYMIGICGSDNDMKYLQACIEEWNNLYTITEGVKNVK